MLRVICLGSNWAVTRSGQVVFQGPDFAVAVLVAIRMAAPVDRKV